MIGSKQQASDLNILIEFLACRDLPELTAAALETKFGMERVDLLIYVAGSTRPAVVEPIAEAYQNGLAKQIMVVGGKGHTTDQLRNGFKTHPIYCSVPTKDRAEADLFADLLTMHLGIPADEIWVENRSTHCGRNAIYALEVARRGGAVPKSAVLVQDPAMQRRTLESFKHAWRNEETKFISFAPFIPRLGSRAGALYFVNAAHENLHSIEHVLKLAMGEIPRLRDDEDGYGPRGAGFFGHVEIPEAVETAFGRLLEGYSSRVRK